MTALNSAVLAFASIVLVAAIAMMLLAALRLSRARRRARQRVVESPNSHYTSPIVAQNETRHRWHNMPLNQLHEINRAEVERLLARLEVISVDALRPAERVFLDRMAEIAAAAPPVDVREAAPQGTAGLRHRTA